VIRGPVGRGRASGSAETAAQDHLRVLRASAVICVEFFLVSTGLLALATRAKHRTSVRLTSRQDLFVDGIQRLENSRNRVADDRSRSLYRRIAILFQTIGHQRGRRDRATNVVSKGWRPASPVEPPGHPMTVPFEAPPAAAYWLDRTGIIETSWCVQRNGIVPWWI
jgi:hypothetical protein